MSELQGWIVVGLVSVFLFKHWWLDRKITKRNKEMDDKRDNEIKQAQASDDRWKQLLQELRIAQDLNTKQVETFNKIVGEMQDSLLVLLAEGAVSVHSKSAQSVEMNGVTWSIEAKPRSLNQVVKPRRRQKKAHRKGQKR